ncbi:zinc finger protein 831 [Perognathus longimembris pacificus]|uniref:zinc finger protein 831 n=1 Tax=Perognathus longimembris pacificus TaxID=214514 RepID=UPI002019CBBF|nr:zinc finger protein 831 [Perognathus longimembris pacificus]
MDKFSLKGISPSAGEHGGCSPLDMADASGLSVPPCPGSPPGKAGVLLQDKGLDFVLLPSQDQDSADPSARVSSDAQESSPCECTGTAPHQLPTTSAAPVWIPVGVQGADEQDPSPAAEAARPPSSPARPAAGPAAQALWTETPFPAPKTVGVAALGSPGKASLEMPASGLSSTSAQQEEGRPQAGFPPGAGYPCGGVAVPSPAPGQGSGKRQSALIPPRGCALPPSLGQPSELPEAPSRSIRKRSLEGMRKQTRVELSDTSSDDEDRLVIEI